MEDPTPFGTALHDRVRDEHPDLDHLVRAATRSGTRIRRRRHAVATLVTAGSVAAVAIGVAMLGGSDLRSGGEPDLAVQPTASPSHSSNQPARTRAERAHARALQALQDAPVYVDSSDWRCDQPLDEKFICTHGAASVVVVWRPAETWADHQDVAKAGPETFVSDVHGQFFATVNAGPDTTHAQVVEVGQALIWAD